MLIVQFLILMMLLVVPKAGAVGNCPAANPNDSVADSAALQACLNQGGTLSLVPGTPGYLLDVGLNVVASSTIITSSSGSAQNATLVAMPTLTQALLTLPRNSGLSGLQITYITFDGARDTRTGPASEAVMCAETDRDPASNVVILSGSGHAFNNNRLVNALCGSSLHITATNSGINNNVIERSGRSTYPVINENGVGSIADGITLERCANTQVHGNQITDATDIAIVSFGGPDCIIRQNTIRQVSQHAFGGIVLGASQSDLGTVYHNRAKITNNQIFGRHQMGYGISIGSRNWFNSAVNAGNGMVEKNTVDGAAVNLIVDDGHFITIRADNILTNHGIGTPSQDPACLGKPAYAYNLHVADSDRIVSLIVPDGTIGYHNCLL